MTFGRYKAWWTSLANKDREVGMRGRAWTGSEQT
jgi:hypothetical protein